MTLATNRHALLTTAEMYRADAAAMAAGISGPALMEAAGRAVADIVIRRWAKRPVVALCGPGNNGGDGFVAARHLADAGWSVRVALLGERAALKGDAAWAAGRWHGGIVPLGRDALAGAGLVIDAIFGAGLDRPLAGAAVEAIAALRTAALPIIAVDVPSGVSGDSGAVLGDAAPAHTTVTFFRRKPGHLLVPGRDLCGEVVVADIGIPEAVLAEIQPRSAANDPDLWRAARPPLRSADHKYTRGHVAVVAGAMAGAAQLAASAAAHVGAGMVTVLTQDEPAMEFAGLPAAIIRGPLGKLAEFAPVRKLRALLIGPGLGRSADARRVTEDGLALGLPLVLDANSLTAFAGEAHRSRAPASIGACGYAA